MGNSEHEKKQEAKETQKRVDDTPMGREGSAEGNPKGANLPDVER